MEYRLGSSQRQQEILQELQPKKHPVQPLTKHIEFINEHYAPTK
jgi:hypothetical protein